jgi:hypothetical protein
MGSPTPISFHEVLILILLFVASMGVIFTALVLILRKRHSQSVKFDPIHISELIQLIISVGSFVIVCITLVFLVL